MLRASDVASLSAAGSRKRLLLGGRVREGLKARSRRPRTSWDEGSAEKLLGRAVCIYMQWVGAEK